MSQPIEELRQTVLALTTTVSSDSVRYRLCEIHERLLEEIDATRPASRGPAARTSSTDGSLS